MTSSNITIGSAKRLITARLAPLQGEREARWIARIVMEHVVGLSTVDLLLKADRELTPETADRIERITQRVASGEPVQYVLGRAQFYGMEFRVDSSVLIPRPETAELVDIIVADFRGREDLRVLDAGAGSGCIAVALALNLPFSAIRGIDISPEAVNIARENATLLHARGATFEVADMLTLSVPSQSLDIVVSNPPYIAEREAADMESNVLDYEPREALFVPDDDPLRYYSAVTNLASEALVDGGRLYYEINPLFADELALQTREAGFEDVQILPDSHGRRRFLKATKP